MSETSGMDIQQQRNTYSGFMVLLKWSTIAIVIVLGLMALFLL